MLSTKLNDAPCTLMYALISRSTFLSCFVAVRAKTNCKLFLKQTHEEKEKEERERERGRMKDVVSCVRWESAEWSLGRIAIGCNCALTLTATLAACTHFKIDRWEIKKRAWEKSNARLYVQKLRSAARSTHAQKSRRLCVIFGCRKSRRFLGETLNRTGLSNEEGSTWHRFYMLEHRTVFDVSKQ